MPISSWELGNAIRTARMRKGYTQDKLSEFLDITPGHLQQMEGGRRNPSVPLLLQMMEVLDFSVDALVFPKRAQERIIYTDQLTYKEYKILEELANIFRENKKATEN